MDAGAAKIRLVKNPCLEHCSGPYRIVRPYGLEAHVRHGTGSDENGEASRGDHGPFPASATLLELHVEWIQPTLIPGVAVKRVCFRGLGFCHRPAALRLCILARLPTQWAICCLSASG